MKELNDILEQGAEEAVEWLFIRKESLKTIFIATMQSAVATYKNRYSQQTWREGYDEGYKDGLYEHNTD